MFLNRPADNRPQSRDANGAGPVSTLPTEFQPLFAELLSTRTQYEALRSSDGSFLERAALMDRLHELRSDLARRRRSLR